MHARISIVTDATDIERGLGFIRDQVLPDLQQQRGFRGLSASGDRSSGVVNVLSMWDSEADLDASESTADKARSDAVRLMGGQVSVERYEQILSEVGETLPRPGAKLQIRHIKMDPATIDENLEFFRQNVLPEIKSTPGFLGVRLLTNRSTGEGRVGTIWADEESLQVARERSEQRRARASDRGVEFGEEQSFEVIFSSMQP
jgi:heme-degrading monooxygenase HmoA